jgi:hypothetical protein
MPKIDDSMVLLVEEQKKLVKLQIEKVSISLPSDRAKNSKLDRYKHVKFVEKHPLWSRQRIVAVFPEIEPVIDLVMDV